MRLLLVLLLLSSHELYAQYAKGCLKEETDTNMVYRKKYPVSRDKSLPSSYSLLKYAPPVESQGSLGSCTSWSCAYAGLTIVKRIEQDDLYTTPFSPLDLHNRLKTKNGEEPCIGGNYIFDALQMLKDYGCDKYSKLYNYCKNESSSKYYYERLYDFERLEVSVYDFKSSLNENSPIIISMTSYNNGWDKNSNIINGIWNGYHGVADGSLHAMCIVGYNDYIGGGAFQVMNSWGKDWGNNGFFWLKYEDLYTLTNAYNLKPNSSIKSDDNIIVINDVIKKRPSTNYFRLYNQCSLLSYVAITKRVNGYWNSVGWYAIQPGGYYDYYIGDRDADEIYWIATGQNNKLWWYSSENNSRSFCYDAVNRFDKSEYESCNQKIKYYYLNPEINGYNGIVSHTISCPNYYNSRGESGALVGEVSDLKFDNRRADTANKFWKKDYLLFDYHSNKMIQPNSNEKKELSYNIWYVDEKNKVINIVCTPEKLENINYFKFATKENAMKWLEIKGQSK